MTTKTFTLSGAAAALTALAASPALAHPGDHGGLDTAGLIAHFVQEPFHAAGLLAAVVIAGFAFIRIRKAKAKQSGK